MTAINQRRRQQGVFYNLAEELRFNAATHRSYFRMTPTQMDHILSVIGADLQRQDTNYRLAVEPKQRLVVTLRKANTQAFAMIIMVLGREQGGPQWASIWRLKAQGGIAPPLLTPSISDKLHGLRC